MPDPFGSGAASVQAISLLPGAGHGQLMWAAKAGVEQLVSGVLLTLLAGIEEHVDSARRPRSDCGWAVTVVVSEVHAVGADDITASEGDIHRSNIGDARLGRDLMAHGYVAKVHR